MEEEYRKRVRVFSYTNISDLVAKYKSKLVPTQLVSDRIETCYFWPNGMRYRQNNFAKDAEVQIKTVKSKWAEVIQGVVLVKAISEEKNYSNWTQSDHKMFLRCCCV